MVRVRVAIPHFFSEGMSEGSGGYGSGRKGNRLKRSIAFSRCLSSLFTLARAEQDLILNIAEKCIELSSPLPPHGLSTVQLEVHLFVCGDYWLADVLELFESRIEIHRIDLDDPRELPLEAARFLLQMKDTADLYLYLEDDLVIQDLNYFDKITWFQEATRHEYVLMPHRREMTISNAPKQLFVDGPIKPMDQISKLWAREESVYACHRYLDGQEIGFVKTANPHSGSFCISRNQLQALSEASWPPPVFIGPLETAATGIILPHYPIMKPSWECRNFFVIEHGNPSFLGFINNLPHVIQS